MKQCAILIQVLKREKIMDKIERFQGGRERSGEQAIHYD